MKRYGHLYEKVIDIENLRLADTKARKGKSKRYGVRNFDKDPLGNLEKLHKILKEKQYHTSTYDVFKVYEPKEREIYRLPYFPDRIVHHAIMNVLEPIFVNYFTNDTYACIKKRGIHLASKRLKHTLRKHPELKYCLKIDIVKFYPSINHECLKAIVRKKLKDPDLIYLIDEIIDSCDGLPIGNYLSQYLANVYMTEFDHWVKEVKKVEHYFRYADDVVVLHENIQYLSCLLPDFELYLSRKLKLTVKRNKQIFPIAENHADRHGRGIDYLGYVFYRKETRIRKSIKQNFARKIARLRKAKISEKDFMTAISSWYGWCKYSDSKHLVEKLNKTSNYEISIRQQA